MEKFVLHINKDGEHKSSSILEKPESEAIADAKAASEKNKGAVVSLKREQTGESILHIPAPTFTTTAMKANGERAGRFHFDTREADAHAHAKGWVNSDPDVHTAVVTNDKNEVVKEYGKKVSENKGYSDATKAEETEKME